MMKVVTSDLISHLWIQLMLAVRLMLLCYFQLYCYF